jgi:hypothetical protein
VREVDVIGALRLAAAVWALLWRKTPGLPPGQNPRCHIIVLHQHEVVDGPHAQCLVPLGFVGLQGVEVQGRGRRVRWVKKERKLGFQQPKPTHKTLCRCTHSNDDNMLLAGEGIYSRP